MSRVIHRNIQLSHAVAASTTTTRRVKRAGYHVPPLPSELDWCGAERLLLECEMASAKTMPSSPLTSSTSNVRSFVNRDAHSHALLFVFPAARRLVEHHQVSLTPTSNGFSSVEDQEERTTLLVTLATAVAQFTDGSDCGGNYSGPAEIMQAIRKASFRGAPAARLIAESSLSSWGWPCDPLPTKGAADAASEGPADPPGVQNGATDASNSVSVLAAILSIAEPQRCASAVAGFIGREQRQQPSRVESDVQPPSESLVSSRPSMDLTALRELWKALLLNSAFFSISDELFVVMHQTLLRMLSAVVVTAETRREVRSLDWQPLLHKTARVYSKTQRGQLLLEIHTTLCARIPGIQQRMPETYFLRIAGCLFDEGVSRPAVTDVQKQWASLLAIVKRSLLQFGRRQNFYHDLWHVSFKAALQWIPEHQSWDRALELAQTFADAGFPYDMDKSMFSQCVRLSTESLTIAVKENDMALIGKILPKLVTFFECVKSLSFLWILDAVSAVLASISEDTATGSASDNRNVAKRGTSVLVQEFVTSVRALFERTNVTGVDLTANPRIRRSLEFHGVVEPSPFWWTCGCGSENPSSAPNCFVCLRSSSRTNWTCKQCNTHVRAKNKASSCTGCGALHPRHLAARAHGLEFCNHCRGFKQRDGSGACATCESSSSLDGSGTAPCSNCRRLYARSALHCPSCFERNPAKPAVQLWQCHECFNFTFSQWSVCQRCPTQVSKKSNALVVSFEPWACGCGARNHPCRVSCQVCSKSSTESQFQCHRCEKQSTCDRSSIVSYEAVDRGRPVQLRITRCSHCEALHPRDFGLIAKSGKIAYNCSCCGSNNEFSKDKGRPHTVCPRCHALQTPEKSLLPFRCTGCGAPNDHGYACKTCKRLRESVDADQVFVWRCMHEEAAGQLCGKWNPSWLRSCQHCQTHRCTVALSSTSTDGEGSAEIRAKYLPWQCSDCGAKHDATTVLFCPSCETGVQPHPECERCQGIHLTLNCPTEEELQYAEKVLHEVELSTPLPIIYHH